MSQQYHGNLLSSLFRLTAVLNRVCKGFQLINRAREKKKLITM